jgi:hypothetical protein
MGEDEPLSQPACPRQGDRSLARAVGRRDQDALMGLDPPAVPCSRPIALSLKFELVTMLRGKEYMQAVPEEFC